MTNYIAKLIKETVSLEQLNFEFMLQFSHSDETGAEYIANEMPITKRVHFLCANMYNIPEKAFHTTYFEN